MLILNYLLKATTKSLATFFDLTLRVFINFLKVEFVACGEEHTVCLTAEGGVFSWGHGQDGQLGHGTLANQNAPRKIAELMGDSVVQIAAGRRHTIVLTNKRKVIKIFIINLFLVEEKNFFL